MEKGVCYWDFVSRKGPDTWTCIVPAFEREVNRHQGVEGLLPETLCSAVSSCVAQSTKLGHVLSSIRRHIVIGDKEH